MNPTRTILIAAALAVVPVLVADEPEARAIMERVDAVEEGNHVVSDMEMKLIDRRGNERVRRIRSFTKDRGEDRLQTMFFQYPPDVEGTAFLTYDYSGNERDDDQWLYLPALGKTKRIASSGKSGSFMGSDFNYSDLASRELDDFNYSLIREDEVRGEKVWIIQTVPRSRKVIEETGYEKSLLLVRQDNYKVVRAVSWVKGGEDLRYLDVQQLELIEGIWVATKMRMTTKRGSATRHATVLTLSDVKFNQQLEDELFTVHRLEAGL
ncbi:MAG: outer membrane lipoprotein-sorting protein [bacterium]|nr:outer membrane lipoprotein-sorting protein [bacterium]